MSHYVKKPITVEAVQFTGDNFTEILDFTNNNFAELTDHDDPDVVAEVYDQLHSTWVGVKLNQWIIKGVKGEFYPCHADVFSETYRPDPNTGSDYIDIGPECFSDAAETVISWKGENFYRACGYPVADLEGGVRTTCLKRLNHPSKLHEDFDGRTYHEIHGVNPDVLAVPLPKLFPTDIVVTKEMILAAWKLFVLPNQEAGEPQSEELRTVMSCLRAINESLPADTRQIVQSTAIETPEGGTTY